MTVFAGQGEARRSMTLLWRTPGVSSSPGGPGPRRTLTVDLIVDAAIAIADTDGMAGLSMRAVGQRLGRTAMALYTYVPDKNLLIDLMYDRVLAGFPADRPPDGGWRDGVAGWAEALWIFSLRHPWTLQVSQARPVLGPNEFVVLETLVALLRGTGLPAGELRRMVGTVFQFVRGVARTVAETRQAPTVTGTAEDEWWYARSALLTEVAPDFAARFPALTWMEGEGGFRMSDESVPYLEQEARETFEAGLVVLLDGISAAVARG